MIIYSYLTMLLLFTNMVPHSEALNGCQAKKQWWTYGSSCTV